MSARNRVVVAVGAVVAAGVVVYGLTAPMPSPAPPAASPPASATAAAAPGVLPDRALTPGAAGTSMAEICPSVDPRLEAQRPGAALKARVYAEYGIPAGQRRLYRVDHDIPLGLDGENVLANLWPQPLAESLRKDRVEDALHRAVCAGRVGLAAAQRAVAADWRTAESVLGVVP